MPEIREENSISTGVQTEKPSRSPLDRLCRCVYWLGAQTLRRLHRVRRAARKHWQTFAKWFSDRWWVFVRRPVRRYTRRMKGFFCAFPPAFRELGAAAKKNIFKVFPCFFGLIGRAARHYREALHSIVRLIAPIAAAAVLIVTVNVWLNTDFCLALTYEGQELGYIDSENTFIDASALAKERVVDVDNTFSLSTTPGVSVRIRGERETMSENELCDAILGVYGDEFHEASGLYVDGDFLGAMESSEGLQNVLDGILKASYNASDPKQRAEFVQDVETVDGLFAVGSIIDATQMKAKLRSMATVEKTYTVVKGDSISRIAVKNDMTMRELRELNPTYADTNMVHVGDVMIVQEAVPFLQVKVIKTVQYSEKIAFSTQYVSNNNKPVTYSKVKTKGVDGTRAVTADITYIDGKEVDRVILSTDITKQPVTQIVERGTKKVKSQSGKTIVIGDGKTIGNMIWPVPICHNMSRGFGNGHSGLDICNGPITVRNKPAIAADGGTVIYAGWYSGYGNYVKIQHANGLCTAYGHLNSISVVKGQKVSRGQQVGLIGSTGRSSGPHLHFEVIKNGVRVNPLNYVRP